MRVPNCNRKNDLSQQEFLELVKDGRMFGGGLFDLRVPEDKWDEYEDFPPFVYNREIDFEV